MGLGLEAPARTARQSPRRKSSAPSSRSCSRDLRATSGPTSTNAIFEDDELDGDAGAGTNFAAFDAVNVVFADSAIGTIHGERVWTVATDSTSYASLIEANNVAQNSWNYSFSVFRNSRCSTRTRPAPTRSGCRLSAKGTTDVLARGSIDINVVPLPATLPLLLGAIGAVGFIRRKKRV